MNNPYPTLIRDFRFQQYLISLGYPTDIVKLLYPQYTETVSAGRSDVEIWLDQSQNTDVTSRRVTGHDIHLYIHNQDMFARTFTFHELRFYEVYPKTIPTSWYQYTSVIAWKGVALNQFGDMCYPSLYLKDPTPNIRWIPLAFLMNAGEGTLLTTEEGD